MKKPWILLATFLFCKLLTAQTIYDANVELRTVGTFQSIEVSSGVEVFFTIGDAAVAVSARDAGLRERIRTNVKDGVLQIYVEAREGVHFNFGNSNRIRAYISNRELQSVKASGGARVMLQQPLRQKSLAVDLSGGSKFTGELEVEKLTVMATGGSDLSMTGKAVNLSLQARDGSDLDGLELETEFAYLNASDGSDISVTVNGELWAEASSAADIHWKGRAAIKKSTTSGAATITQQS